MVNHVLLASLTVFTLGTPSILGVGELQESPTVHVQTEVDAAMGPASEYQQGLTVNDVAPMLRSVTVGGETSLAYCIEYWVRAAEPDHKAEVTGWDGFTGTNHFKTDAKVREAVAWILHNSYPTISLNDLETRIDADELTASEAIAATQAAIWFYTDDFVSDGMLAVAEAPGAADRMKSTSSGNVEGLFDYLTGENNVGLSEQALPSNVTLQALDTPTVQVPETLAAEEDHLLGPVKITSTADQVELRLEGSDPTIQLDQLTVLDNQGQIVDLTAPVAAEEIWLHVPADTPSGSVHIAAETIEYGYTGRLIIPDPTPDRRYQTMVVVDQTVDTATAAFEMQWQHTVETPPPSMSPSQEPDVSPEPEASAQPISDEQTSEGAEPEETQPITQPAEVAPSESVHETQTTPPESAKPEVPAEADQVAHGEEQLAETGAHQTRNILVALGTLALGGVFILINRWRRRHAST